MKRTCFFLLGAVLLAACGSGGGGTGTAPPPPPPPVTSPPPDGGVDRGGVARGAITGFGSVIVNGIRFDTSVARFTIDDNPGSQDDLSVGQVVTVIGSIGDDGVSGGADEVIYDGEVSGPIASIDVTGGVVLVLGQTIRIDRDTAFDDDIVPDGIAGLSVGDRIEASGFVGADGSVAATWIERAATDEFELTGIVASLDSGGMTFAIGAQVVDYSAALLTGFPQGLVEEGQRVEAKGSALAAAGELLADEVEFEDDDLPAGNDDEIEIEGLITRFASASDFDVAGLPVTTSEATIYENGSAGDLATGLKVEVEGQFDIEGVLVAAKVSLRRTSTVELWAPVDAVDAAAARLTVLGVDIGIAAATRFEDNSELEQPSFGPADLVTGDWVEIKAWKDAAGELVATQVERDDAGDEVEIEAPVEAVMQPDLVLLGLTVQTGATTGFEDHQDNPISAAEFFARVAAGRAIQVEGLPVGDGVIAASEVELEGGDENDAN